MNLSYWEYKTWLSNIDFTVVGSGIVGLNCALQLKIRFPKAKVLVLEKGILPQGASTKNAGFACFGSISEILSDLKVNSEDDVFQLVKKRWEGIKLLRQNLGDGPLDFKQYGGHELFTQDHEALYQECLNRLESVNHLLKPIFGDKAFQRSDNTFHFKKIQENYITNGHEAQIDTGKMMQALCQLTQKKGAIILYSVAVQQFVDNGKNISVQTDKFEFQTKKLLIATNGFANGLLKESVIPARAQVLITKPLQNLHIKGTFHLDEGYYYFRNIDDRILFGGGRNLDFKGEETDGFGVTKQIQDRLEQMLKEIIIPGVPFEVERRWSGIMGMGDQKRPIVKQVSTNVYCGVRLGGMGIAIGSLVGKELAGLV